MGLRERKLCVAELDALLALPSGVRGPVDRWAFRLFAANFAAETICLHLAFRVQASAWGFEDALKILGCC